MTAPVLAALRRGAAVESTHRGAIAVANAAGEVVAAAGDPDFRSIARSSIKPLQALPLVADGGADHFELSHSELAVVCGSHGGESFHTAAVESILKKAGVTEASLECGAHFPFHQPTADDLRRRGEPARQIHDNCSGKHAGMIACARHQGWEVAGYVALDHPVQARIRQMLETFTGSAHSVETSAIDGCGAPTYLISVRELATAFARLAAPRDLPVPWKAAADRITAAMLRFPEMVGGTERFDTVLMRVAADRLVAKGGGEAIWAAGIPDRGVGVALKIEDGSHRAVAPVAVEALHRLGVLTDEEVHVLRPHHHPPLLNRKGLQVGEIVPEFELR